MQDARCRTRERGEGRKGNFEKQRGERERKGERGVGRLVRGTVVSKKHGNPPRRGGARWLEQDGSIKGPSHGSVPSITSYLLVQVPKSSSYLYK